MVLSIIVPHFPALGSGGVPPVPPIILMSGYYYLCFMSTLGWYSEFVLPFSTQHFLLYTFRIDPGLIDTRILREGEGRR